MCLAISWVASEVTVVVLIEVLEGRDEGRKRDAV
jgi:hypothetical protein